MAALGCDVPATPPSPFPEKYMAGGMASRTNSLVTDGSVNSCVALLA